jgi:hypothetical protein
LQQAGWPQELANPLTGKPRLARRRLIQALRWLNQGQQDRGLEFLVLDGGQRLTWQVLTAR